MLSHLKSTHIRRASVVARALSSVEKWDLLAAVCLERKPTVLPPMGDLERRFQKQLVDVELERSCRSPHELRQENDLKQLELMKKGDSDIDQTLKQTAQDFVDASLEELNKFKFADKVTEDDKKQNVKSTRRKLEKHLILLTQHRIGDKTYFLPPQGPRREGESLRQAADRVLKETVGNDVKTQIYGNAPTGFYKYKYPKPVQSQSGAVGAKLFIYFARHKTGELPPAVDHKWLDRNELQTELPHKYRQSLQLFLIDE